MIYAAIGDSQDTSAGLRLFQGGFGEQEGRDGHGGGWGWGHSPAQLPSLAVGWHRVEAGIGIAVQFCACGSSHTNLNR